jgi:anti-sigma regulatory factor (Ser/Thr protein kinase)
MARPSRSHEIDNALLQAVGSHPRNLVGMVAAQLGFSTSRISMQVRALAESGYLVKSGSTRPTYALGRNRRFSHSFSRAGLSEDIVWYEHLQPLLRGLPRNVLDIAHQGVTEMVNNAIDHSDAKQVELQMDLRDGQLRLVVSDDGIGIFNKIARALNLPDERLALLELSKGKFTTDPRNHSGEGVFFTSRMFDRFQIHSGGLTFDHDEKQDNDLLMDFDEPLEGTTVFMTIDAASERTPKQVFDEYSSGPDEYAFAKTVVPVRLAQVGDENLVSRSQAKRLLQRVDRFRHVVLDFESVRSIGQAFADEIFRVFVLAHPEVKLVPVHAVPDVQQMIRRAEGARDESGGQLTLI